MNRPTAWQLERLVLQVALAVGIIAAWQFLPMIPALSQRMKIFDTFFISSPVEVWNTLVDLSTGQGGVTVWPYLWVTIESAVVGTTIGLVLGALFGLIFSNSPRVAEVVRPFIVLANSVPRIALIPLFVLLFGTTVLTSIVAVIAIVFFLGFFNAFEGGTSIPAPLLENAIVLGAGPVEIMRFIRLPMVLTWTFAAVPNAISFGLVVAVTTDLLSGIPGMGALLLSATLNVQAQFTFAIIIVLSLLGLALYGGATILRNRVIRW